MYCKNCGKKLNDDSKFCDDCGTAVDQPQTINNKKEKELAVENTVDDAAVRGLIYGILSIVLWPLCFIFTPLGLVFSRRGLKAPNNKGAAIVGLVFSTITLAILIGIIFTIVVIVISATTA